MTFDQVGILTVLLHRFAGPHAAVLHPFSCPIDDSTVLGILYLIRMGLSTARFRRHGDILWDLDVINLRQYTVKKLVDDRLCAADLVCRKATACSHQRGHLVFSLENIAPVEQEAQVLNELLKPDLDLLPDLILVSHQLGLVWQLPTQVSASPIFSTVSRTNW